MKWFKFFVFLIIPCFALSAHGGHYKKKFSAIVIDADTQEVLFDHSADHIGNPASLTKIFTLKMIFDALNAGKLHLQTLIKISKYAASQKPTKMYIRPGHSISVLDAILALVTHSANDVTVAIAEFLSGSEANFAKKMTEEAHALGLKNTYFKNATGLPNNEQRTTPREMAKLTAHLIQNYGPYLQYFSTTSFYFKGKNYRNHNKLLGEVDGVDCCKTGFTNNAGWNLAASAKRGDKRIIAVIMGGPSRQYRDQKMTKLINATFKKLHLNASPQAGTPQDDDIGSLVAELARDSEMSSKASIQTSKRKKKKRAV